MQFRLSSTVCLDKHNTKIFKYLPKHKTYTAAGVKIIYHIYTPKGVTPFKNTRQYTQTIQ